jgi:RNA polymerase sigma-70 factor, ECF subfamily
MERDGNGHSPNTMLLESSKLATQELPVLETQADGPSQLFESHMGFVWRNLLRLGVPESLIEDATQDVFLVVYRRWDTWSSTRSKVETWLFGIVLRVARNYRRSQQRRLAWLLPATDQDALAEVPAMVDGPAEILAQREAAVLFERALTTLDEAKRAVFLLVDVEQLAVSQAALALGININTANWRLRKARLGFRRALQRLRAQEPDADGRKRP